MRFKIIEPSEDQNHITGVLRQWYNVSVTYPLRWKWESHCQLSNDILYKAHISKVHGESSSPPLGEWKTTGCPLQVQRGQDTPPASLVHLSCAPQNYLWHWFWTLKAIGFIRCAMCVKAQRRQEEGHICKSGQCCPVASIKHLTRESLYPTAQSETDYLCGAFSLMGGKPLGT